MTDEDRHMHQEQFSYLMDVYYLYSMYSFYTVYAHLPFMCLCGQTFNLFAMACACKCTGVLETTGLLNIRPVLFTSLSDALKS